MSVKENKEKRDDKTVESERQEAQAKSSLSTKNQEEERQKLWEEAWDRKIIEEERLEDCKARCAPCKFFKKPRVQSNIWVQVNHEKNIQHVQMSFMNTPIPKPRAPILPKLKVIADSEEKNVDDKSVIDEKKKGKRKK